MARKNRKKQMGGYLRGPSHEQGGIPANVRGGSPVELEGGEYIINAQTVNAVGTQFLDKLNSTQTSYHQGGFNRGQLPGSKYRRGGKVRRKLQTGGNTRQCVRHRMPDGTIMEGPTHGTGQTCIEWSNRRNNMRRGGGPRRRLQRGGVARGRTRRRMQQGGTMGATMNDGLSTQRRRWRRRRKVRPPREGRRTGGVVTSRRFAHGGYHASTSNRRSVGRRNVGGRVPITQGNITWHCPAGSKTITSDCVEATRKTSWV